MKQAEEVPAHLPSVAALKDAVKRAREWTNKVTALNKGDTALLETVESLVARGRPITLHLEPLAQLEENIEAAHAWLEKTARTFLKKNSHLTLLEVRLRLLKKPSSIFCYLTINSHRKGRVQSFKYLGTGYASMER